MIRTAPAKSKKAKIEEALGQVMDLTPRGIRKHLDLNKPIYARTSGLRPLRPQGRQRRRLLLGEDRPRRRDQEGRLIAVVFDETDDSRFGLTWSEAIKGSEPMDLRTAAFSRPFSVEARLTIDHEPG